MNFYLIIYKKVYSFKIHIMLYWDYYRDYIRKLKTYLPSPRLSSLQSQRTIMELEEILQRLQDNTGN